MFCPAAMALTQPVQRLRAKIFEAETVETETLERGG
jgi:hypothetical protein